MKNTGIAVALAGAGLAGFAGTEGIARAADTTGPEVAVAPLQAPRGAFELSLDAGYTQGFGSEYGGRSLPDVAGPGLALGLGLGYRVSPLLSLGVTGQIQGFSANPDLPRSSMVRGAAAGVAATFHAAPYHPADPWLSVGTGYRLLWEVPAGTAPTTLTHGFELGRIELGVDLRPSSSIALAPVIGADVDLFAWQKTSATSNVALASMAPSAFVFVGLRGRFDIGGTRVTKVTVRQ